MSQTIVEAKLNLVDADLDSHQLGLLTQELLARFGTILRDRGLMPAAGHTPTLLLRCTCTPDHGRRP